MVAPAGSTPRRKCDEVDAQVACDASPRRIVRRKSDADPSYVTELVGRNLTEVNFMNMQSQIAPEDISAALGLDPGARKRRWVRRFGYAALATAGLGLAGYWYYSSDATASAIAYDTT